MNVSRLSLSLILLPCLCAWAPNPQSPGQKPVGTFRSSAGYTALYPLDWHRLSQSGDYIDLLSGNQYVETTVIAPGEAVLTLHDVRAGDGHTPSTVDAALAGETSDDTFLSRADIAVPRTPGGCSRIVEQRTHGAFRPTGGMIDSTSFFCVLGSRVVKASVMNWQDDPKEAAYVATALDVVKSIRAN